MHVRACGRACVYFLLASIRPLVVVIADVRRSFPRFPLFLTFPFPAVSEREDEKTNRFRAPPLLFHPPPAFTCLT